MKTPGESNVNLQFQPSDMSGGIPQPDTHQANIVMSLHRVLRGRYHWVAMISVTLGICGSIAGYMASTPTYSSSTYIQIHHKIGKILYDTSENERIQQQALDATVAAEATFVQSSRVFNKATDDQNFRASKWPQGAAGAAALKRAFTVNYRRRETLISVKLSHVDPVQAQIGLTAITEAYKELYVGETSLRVGVHETSLKTRKTDLSSEMARIRRNVTMLSLRFSTDDLEGLHDAKLEEMLQITRRLSEIKQQLIALNSKSELENVASQEGDENTDDEANDEKSTMDLLGSLDSTLAQLLSQQSQTESAIQASLQIYGSAHVEIKRLERQLASINAQVTDRALEVQGLVDSGQIAIASQTEMLSGNESIESLQAMHDQFTSMNESVTTDLAAISETRHDIDKLREDLGRLRGDYDEVSRALEAMQFESSEILKKNRGRIEVKEASLPAEYDSDKRKELALIGGGGGVAFGICVVWLLGLIRPSYRYIDDLEAKTNYPILGTLPELSRRDAEQMEMASLSIHHLRNILSLRSGKTKKGKGIAYLVTSARPGDGKTSLCIALGMSFASEGKRTLLLDTDLVGRGLSRSLDLDGQPGFTDVLGQDRFDGEIHSTEIANLWILPTGKPGGLRSEELSSEQIDSVLNRLRDDFEIIVVDTGPLMGSLESNLVASLVDHTVVTVARGQDPRATEATLQRLEAIGGHCAGLVFNRALQQDIARSMSQVSFHSQSIRAPGFDSVSEADSAPSSNPEQPPSSGASSSSDRRLLVRAMMDNIPPSNS